MSFLDAEPLGESRYVSQYAVEAVGLVVHRSGEVADADANLVTVRMESLEATPRVIFERTATHTAPGTYEALLSSVETAAPGRYVLRWSYALDGVPQSFVSVVEVGESNGAYDRLDVGFKAVIESVWSRFADLFDSPDGGPHLQVYWQTRFGRGRLAQLLSVALGKLNTVAQPHMTYTLDGEGGAQFPFARWGALLEQALYVEVIKHLRRSYTEQPDASGVTVARLDRKDYMQRWGEILRDEEATFKDQMDGFKIAHMGLGRPHVLVSGGVYGNYGPNRLPGNAAARPRYWARFH